MSKVESETVVENVSDIVTVESRLELMTIRYGELFLQVLMEDEDNKRMV